MRHPDIESIERLIGGELGVLARMTVSRHLKKCAACAKLAEEVSKDNELIASLRTACRKFRDFERSGQADTILSKLETRLGGTRPGKSRRK